MTTLRTGPSVLLVFFALGCGGGGTTEETTTVADEPQAWEQMSFDERKAFMASDVMPRMAPLFEQHDAERFAGFSCANCHGDDAQARNFEMPNPSIMALYPTGTQEQQRMVQEQRPMVMFMFNQVLPAMQELLGAQPYDEATQTGFSCYACHPSGGAGTPAEEPTAYRRRLHELEHDVQALKDRVWHVRTRELTTAP
jgi:cytochrome c553